MPRNPERDRPTLTPSMGAAVRDGQLQFPANDPGEHGERARLAAFQQAGRTQPGTAPPTTSTATAPPGSTPVGTPPIPPSSPSPLPPDPFGPTERPDEPVASPLQDDLQAEDPDILLRYIYAQYPHPDIRRLLARRSV